MEYNFPEVKVFSDGDDTTKIELLKPMEFYADGARHTIPKGFVCDGASIPRFFWRWFGHPLEGNIIHGAIVHDFCYRTACVTRKDADALFLSLMREYGVPVTKRVFIWLAVRLFGGNYYGKDKK